MKFSLLSFHDFFFLLLQFLLKTICYYLVFPNLLWIVYNKNSILYKKNIIKIYLKTLEKYSKKNIKKKQEKTNILVFSIHSKLLKN